MACCCWWEKRCPSAGGGQYPAAPAVEVSQAPNVVELNLLYRNAGQGGDRGRGSGSGRGGPAHCQKQGVSQRWVEGPATHDERVCPPWYSPLDTEQAVMHICALQDLCTRAASSQP